MSDVREQEQRAADRRTANKLLEIADEVASCRLLTEAAYMAAGSLQRHESGPLTQLLDIVVTRLRTIGDDLRSGYEGSDADAA